MENIYNFIITRHTLFFKRFGVFYNICTADEKSNIYQFFLLQYKKNGFVNTNFINMVYHKYVNKKLPRRI